jgi:hypothetical protein
MTKEKSIIYERGNKCPEFIAESVFDDLQHRAHEITIPSNDGNEGIVIAMIIKHDSGLILLDNSVDVLEVRSFLMGNKCVDTYIELASEYIDELQLSWSDINYKEGPGHKQILQKLDSKFESNIT